MGFSDTEPWRIGLLFVIFTVISIAFVYGNDNIEVYLRRKKLHALRHVLDAFREELLLLGFISLLLSAFQQVFQEMCVGATVDALQVAADVKYGENTCPEGQAAFWDAKTLHQTHIFIFILACTHIAYACLSMTLCVKKINRWRKFEEEARSSNPATLLRPLSGRLAPSCGQGGRHVSLMRLIWRSFVAQFLDSTNKAVYLDLRRLFIERTGAPHEFDFLSFLVQSMQEDYAKIIGINYFMWLLAAVYVVIPQFAFLPTSIFTLIVMLIMGTVLESIQLRLTACSYQLFNLSTPGSLKNDLSLTPLPSSVATTALPSLASPTLADGSIQQQQQRDKEREKQLRLARAVMAQRLDAANFFWRGKPKYMLKVFQFVLFENAMSLSMLTFSMWQDPAYLTSNIQYGYAAVITILVVDFFIMLHTSVFVLPVYAITASVGSHSSLSVSNLARKKAVSGAHAMEIFRRKGKRGSSSKLRSGHSERTLRDGRDDGSGSDGGGSETSVSAAQRREYGKKWDRLGVEHADGEDDGRLSDLEEDYEAENARSVTYLMGAILTKQLHDIRARKKLEELEEMEHASGGSASGGRGSGDCGDSGGSESGDDATIRIDETVGAVGDDTVAGPSRLWTSPSRLWMSPSSSSPGAHADADAARASSSYGFSEVKRNGRSLDRQSSGSHKTLTQTPSLARLFSTDAADGISELDRMTGGLEACLADAAEVAEAYRAGSPRRHSLHGSKARMSGNMLPSHPDSAVHSRAGSVISFSSEDIAHQMETASAPPAPHADRGVPAPPLASVFSPSPPAPGEQITHQTEAASISRAGSGVPSLESVCSPSPSAPGGDVNHQKEIVVAEATLGSEAGVRDANTVHKEEVWLAMD